MLEPSRGKTKISGRYKVMHPMANFKVRVKIVQQKSPLAELFDKEDETRDGNFLEDEEYTFGWQEKVLGPYEIKYYRDEVNCLTDRHKEYRQRILEMSDAEEGSRRLYSYVQGDAYYPDADLLTVKFRSCLSLRNERATPSVKNRKPFVDRYNKQVIEERPSDARIHQNHYLYKEEERMYVMVDLSPRDEASVDSTNSEVMLCSISYDPVHETLTVSPDFSEEECYSVEGVGMSYDFWIYHASSRPTTREIQRHRENAKKEHQRIRDLKEAQLYHELEVPGLRVMRLFLTLDIGTARDFDHDDALFVSYRIDLPKRWRSSGCLSGRTQRCRARYRRANFGYCVDMMLELDLGHKDEEVASVSWPWLILSVGSLDPWTRYRIEGYGSVPVPRSPGRYELEVKTWRPACNFLDGLRRYFTGGNPELEDPSWCGLPPSHEGPRLDKRILKVVPSGELELRLNLALQGLGAAMEDYPGMDHHYLLGGVDDVLTRFKEARERMIQARAMCPQ